MSTPERPEIPVSHSTGGCLLRLSWMLLGNVALFLSGLSITQQRSLSGADVVYGLALLFLITARYFDITRFHGRTASDKPATLKTWGLYVAVLAPVAVGAWLIAHALAA